MASLDDVLAYSIDKCIQLWMVLIALQFAKCMCEAQVQLTLEWDEILYFIMIKKCMILSKKIILT